MDHSPTAVNDDGLFISCCMYQHPRASIRRHLSLVLPRHRPLLESQAVPHTIDLDVLAAYPVAGPTENLLLGFTVKPEPSFKLNNPQRSAIQLFELHKHVLHIKPTGIDSLHL